jgi:two-component sensor histidine kinase
MAGLCFDVTERRHAQETHDLLNRELSHRLKNLLSVVGSLAVMTGEHKPDARDFVTSFQARLSNLAAAHDLLVQAEWQPIALAKLVEKALGLIGVLDRIDLDTHDLVLGSYDTQTVVLLLHELSTNAIKYGALSNGSGRIKLAFEVKQPTANPAGAPLLLLVWEENGGPSVTIPPTKGFGISLLERLARGRERGRPVIEWRQEGLRCSIALPISPPRRR